jgi:hypothetical protein
LGASPQAAIDDQLCSLLESKNCLPGVARVPPIMVQLDVAQLSVGDKCPQPAFSLRERKAKGVSTEMLNQYLPESINIAEEVEPILRSILQEPKPPLELAKAIVTLANQFSQQGDGNTAEKLKTIANNIVDKVVNEGIEGLTDLT